MGDHYEKQCLNHRSHNGHSKGSRMDQASEDGILGEDWDFNLVQGD